MQFKQKLQVNHQPPAIQCIALCAINKLIDNRNATPVSVELQFYSANKSILSEDDLNLEEYTEELYKNKGFTKRRNSVDGIPPNSA